jgi:hypothetical protein
MRLATKNARVHHIQSAFHDQLPGGMWHTACGRLAPEITEKESERRGLLPCRACLVATGRIYDT